MLPNCILNGVAKSGTTALYRYLHEHPDVFMSSTKELNYFAYAEDIGEKEKNNAFPARNLGDYKRFFETAGPAVIRGEASPLYFSSEVAAANIKQSIPDVKLITNLRNPVDRAYSAYLMRYRKGRASDDLYSEMMPDKHHVKNGFYFDNLKRYYNLFSSDQIKIVLFDELHSDTAAVVNNIYSWLGVGETSDIDFSKRYNSGYIPKNILKHNLIRAKRLLPNSVRTHAPGFLRNKLKSLENSNKAVAPELPFDLRASLVKIYESDVRRVQDLIERDLSHWMKI